MLGVRGLGVPGLEPVTFDLETGGCLAIQGASGSGKSRLLRAIADLDPNTGEVRLDDASRADLPAPDWDAIADELEPLGLPSECRDWPVSRLSTGERQRLALLRALAIGPRVLLLDEPTSGLDEAATRAVEALIARRRADGLAVVWVTHDAQQARRVGQRVLLVRRGEVLAA